MVILSPQSLKPCKGTGCFRETHRAETDSWEGTPLSRLRDEGSREARLAGSDGQYLTRRREQHTWVDSKQFSNTAGSELAEPSRKRCAARRCGPGWCGCTRRDWPEVTCPLAVVGRTLCFCPGPGPSLTSTWVDRGFGLVEGGRCLRAVALEMRPQTRSVSIT